MFEIESKSWEGTNQKKIMQTISTLMTGTKWNEPITPEFWLAGQTPGSWSKNIPLHCLIKGNSSLLKSYIALE